MLKFDLHMHTNRYSPDSVSDPLELARRAVKIGLDGIVFTEHDRLWPEDELEELRQQVPGLIILAGVEITGRGGDMLCYGIQSLDRLDRGVDWPKLIEEVHRQGGVAVAAHPFRWGQPFDQLFATNPHIDGLELMSKNMDEEIREKTLRIHEQFPHLAGLGNSDSHELPTLGTCYTLFPKGTRTMPQVLQAIRKAETIACPGPL